MCCGADRRDQNTFTKAPAHSTDGIPVPPAPWLVYLHHGLFHLHHSLFHLHHGLSTCTMACLPEHLWAHCCYLMAIGNLKCFFCTCLVSWSLFMVFLMQRDLQPSLKVFCSLFTANFSQKVQYMHLLVSLN